MIEISVKQHHNNMLNKTIHPDLHATIELIYKRCSFTFSKPIAENESADYGAYTFEINGQNIQFRVAKITPTKIGQFVTVWKRIGKGPIQPFDSSDDIDFIVICTRDNNYFGQFVFPKSVLLQQNIFSKNGKGGKRGFRVYPPWVKTMNSQAQKTQKWQLNYFLEMLINDSIDCKQAKILYTSRCSP